LKLFVKTVSKFNFISSGYGITSWAVSM